jgi:hypothetical protein
LRVLRGLRMPDGGLLAVGGKRPLHKQVGEARRVCPGECQAARRDLLLDDGARVFRNAETAAAAELGEDGGLAGAGTSGDDVEGWERNR